MNRLLAGLLFPLFAPAHVPEDPPKAPEPAFVCKGHTKAVHRLAFSPDGKTFASASADGRVKLWDAATGKEARTLTGHTRWVTTVAFSPDGLFLASGGALDNDNTVRLWDVATWKEVRVLRHRGAVRDLAFSPDGKTLLVGGEGEQDDLSGAFFGELVVWELTTGKWLLAPEGFSGIVRSVVFSPDGKTVVAGNVPQISMWDAATGRLRGKLTGHRAGVESLAFSADGKLLVSGSLDDTVGLWDVERMKEAGVLKGHNHHVYGVAFGRDGKLLASASEDRTLRLWNVERRKELLTLEQDAPVWSVAFSPDGRRLAAGVGSVIKVWDMAALIGNDR
jgi:WD40 repeat protein